MFKILEHFPCILHNFGIYAVVLGGLVVYSGNRNGIKGELMAL